MKKLLIIGLSFLTIGILVTTFFGVVANEKIVKFMEEYYTYHELDYSEDRFSSLDLDIENKNIQVFPSENDLIKISYYQNKYEDYTINDSDQDFKLVNRSRWYSHFLFTYNWFKIFNRTDYHLVKIYLPATQTYELKLDTSNGRIQMKNLTTLDLTISSTNGRIELEHVKANDIIADTSNARIIVSNSKANEINLSSTNGSIDFKKNEATRARLSTTNGSIDVDDCKVTERIDLDTTNGSIEAENVETLHLSAITTNGSIEAEIAGSFEQYRINMHTTNGSLYLNGNKVSQNAYNTHLSNNVELQTTNGSIHLDFSD